MKIKIYFFLIALILQSTYAQHSLIPEPVRFESIDQQFVLNNEVSLVLEYNNEQVRIYVNNFKLFLEKNDLNLNTDYKKSNKNIIISKISNINSELGKEGYFLEVNENTINLSANDPSGIFNGLQTLEQLIRSSQLAEPNTNNGNLIIKGCNIKDYPRFAWRGLMLDVSRHFFSIDDVKSYIEKMAQYKFNVFHWHLTDDEGWRIEIKAFPKLTEVGAWRVERTGRFGEHRPSPKANEKSSYGGFYTQEQIKEVVKFAADRNITIVPEIDVPGHSMALLAAYPELSTKKEPKFVNPGSKFSEWYGDGKFKMLIENTLNPADDNVYVFLDKVFTEVADLFPGQYIHMGGDECYHGFWEKDTSVQKFMSKNNIKDSEELQSYFVKKVEKIISSKGKKMIGWDEILEGGIADGATVMSWRGMKGGIEAAKSGHNVVMSPTTYAYLDYTQGDQSVENPIYDDLSLEKAYSFEPVPNGVDPKFILGGQANLWTEVIPNLQFAFYMTYPRAFAISETLWSPKEKKDWNNFIVRVEGQIKVFDKSKTNISKAVYDPVVEVFYDNNKLMCKLTSNLADSEIYYTVNNTYPVQFGVKYLKPFEIPDGDLSLRTQNFRNGKSIGRELLISRNDLVKRIKK
jgi:hexosaminidase